MGKRVFCRGGGVGRSRRPPTLHRKYLLGTAFQRHPREIETYPQIYADTERCSERRALSKNTTTTVDMAGLGLKMLRDWILPSYTMASLHTVCLFFEVPDKQHRQHVTAALFLTAPITYPALLASAVARYLQIPSTWLVNKVAEQCDSKFRVNHEYVDRTTYTTTHPYEYCTIWEKWCFRTRWR